VRLLDRMREHGIVDGPDEVLVLTARGEAWCGRTGIDLAALAGRRRPVCRGCLDWSERRTHLAGALGAAMLTRLLALRYVMRAPSGRAVDVTAQGESFLHTLAVRG